MLFLSQAPQVILVNSFYSGNFFGAEIDIRSRSTGTGFLLQGHINATENLSHNTTHRLRTFYLEISFV